MNAQPSQFEELADLVWALANDQLDDTGAERLQVLLCTGPEYRRIYIQLMDQFALLEWERGGEKAAGSRQLAVREEGFEATPGEASLQSEVLSPFPTITLDSGSPLNSLPAPFYVAHPCLFSNLFAILVVGLGTLGAWLYQIDIPHPMASVERPHPATPAASSADRIEFVGHITGMMDVTWSDDQTATVNGANVSLGRRYALASGLMEITYDMGAKVILQGPCTYEVESRDGGFLSVGKLTAKLEQKPSAISGQRTEEVAGGQWLVASKEGSGVRGQGAGVTNHKSEIINHKSLAPGFAVRTPTAIVTDLGTEFGVEVDKKGATASHVFRGAVAVRLVAANGKPEDKGQILHADESALIDADKRTISTIRDTKILGEFVRKIPLRVPLRVFNTGKGLVEGEPDLHWEIIRASNDPNFKPRQAAVASVLEGCWGPNEPSRSQWISTEGKSPLTMAGVYTFRTTFDLTGMTPKTAVLRGWFLVDDRMQSMRINGREVPLKETSCGPVPYSLYRRFTIDQGFVEGVNILEIEVINSEADDKTKPNPMGLRIELSGYANQLEEGDEGGS